MIIFNLLVSTIAFFVASFYLKHYFGNMGIDRGMTRSVVVLLLASLASFAVSAATDWVGEKMGYSQSADLSKVLQNISAQSGMVADEVSKARQ